jgi:hypothetical protein
LDAHATSSQLAVENAATRLATWSVGRNSSNISNVWKSNIHAWLAAAAHGHISVISFQ